MFCQIRSAALLWGWFCAAVVVVIVGGCSPAHYKAEADEEVYKIIDSKWQRRFGERVNYTISDVAPAPNDIRLERVVPTSDVITLSQAVAMATAHNRDYQTQKEQLYQTALDLTLHRHKYARQWFAAIGGEYDRAGENNEDVSLYTGEKGPGNTGDKGLGFDHNLLLANGVEITTGLAIDWMRFLTGDPRTSLGSVLSASAAVPLLGAGAGRVARENLTQTERNTLYQIRFFNRYRKTFVVSIVTDYYKVLKSRDKVSNALSNYKRVLESKQRMEMEAKAGRKTPFEVDQTEQKVLTARDNYVSTQQTYKQQLDLFKMRLALPTDADMQLDQNELKALQQVGISQPDYTLDAAIETALLQRLDLVNSADRIDDAVRKAILAEDGLGTQLNLVGNVGIDSVDKTDFNRLGFHQGRYSGGLEADLPLDRKQQRNAYRMALITLKQQQRQYEDDLDTIKLQVRQAYRQLNEAAQRYRIQKEGLKLAEKRVESTALLLDAGRAWARDWLDSQDDLLEAQNNVTDALIDHAVAKLSFFRDVGILQVRPDGMWQQ